MSDKITMRQLAVLPEAWDRLVELVEQQWPSFVVVELPLEAQNDDEVEAGIRTHIMALR